MSLHKTLKTDKKLEPKKFDFKDEASIRKLMIDELKLHGIEKNDHEDITYDDYHLIRSKQKQYIMVGGGSKI